MNPDPSDTIVAISTPPGRGGIGVVRLSGPRAAAIARRIFQPRDGAAAGRPAPAEPASAPPGLDFGRFTDADGAAIDHGYLVIFEAPRGFTGEETAELWSHGSPAVGRALVETAVGLGARPATPGEFALRAFLNGRIDATRAEAIRDLIEARTAWQAQAAFEQVRGRIAAEVDRLKDRLAGSAARLEAAIEFPDEGEAPLFLPEEGIAVDLRAIRASIEALASTWARGRIVREGLRVVIVGAPNAGKSSLFNRLLEESRAIVTPIPGTTRDLLEETVEIDGVPVVLIDTAGLHAPADEAEAEAVRRARDAMERADLWLVVLDRSRALHDEERRLLRDAAERAAIVVLNKSDLPRGLTGAAVRPAIEVSAKTGDGFELLRRRLHAAIGPAGRGEKEGTFVTNVRHRDLLLKAAAAIRRAEGAAGDRMPPECLALDLRDALDRLGEITGAVGVEGIYERIFRDFCIGK
ncbi:MAG: tRNA uridine-5-carboxymethylaminomethyl(34) synthesis GTPase MnmE [Candidatus Polarisedimenticolia bacterium]